MAGLETMAVIFDNPALIVNVQCTTLPRSMLSYVYGLAVLIACHTTSHALPGHDTKACHQNC